MRRTRHVVLPVRSWQYIGLLLVSLACVTFGLVARDREGQAGSLTGPELLHRAPHDVDVCPNLDPFQKSPTCLDSLEKQNPVSKNKEGSKTDSGNVRIEPRRSIESSTQRIRNVRSTNRKSPNSEIQTSTRHLTDRTRRLSRTSNDRSRSMERREEREIDRRVVPENRDLKSRRTAGVRNIEKREIRGNERSRDMVRSIREKRDIDRDRTRDRRSNSNERRESRLENRERARDYRSNSIVGRDSRLENRERTRDRRSTSIERRPPRLENREMTRERRSNSVERRESRLENREMTRERRSNSVERRESRLENREVARERRSNSVERRESRLENREMTRERRSNSIEKRGSSSKDREMRLIKERRNGERRNSRLNTFNRAHRSSSMDTERRQSRIDISNRERRSLSVRDRSQARSTLEIRTNDRQRQSIRLTDRDDTGRRNSRSELRNIRNVRDVRSRSQEQLDLGNRREDRRTIEILNRRSRSIDRSDLNRLDRESRLDLERRISNERRASENLNRRLNRRTIDIEDRKLLNRRSRSLDRQNANGLDRERRLDLERRISNVRRISEISNRRDNNHKDQRFNRRTIDFESHKLLDRRTRSLNRRSTNGLDRERRLDLNRRISIERASEDLNRHENRRELVNRLSRSRSTINSDFRGEVDRTRFGRSSESSYISKDRQERRAISLGRRSLGEGRSSGSTDRREIDTLRRTVRSIGFENRDSPRVARYSSDPSLDRTRNERTHRRQERITRERINDDYRLRRSRVNRELNLSRQEKRLNRPLELLNRSNSMERRESLENRRARTNNDRRSTVLSTERRETQQRRVITRSAILRTNDLRERRSSNARIQERSTGKIERNTDEQRRFSDSNSVGITERLMESRSRDQRRNVRSNITARRNLERRNNNSRIRYADSHLDLEKGFKMIERSPNNADRRSSYRRLVDLRQSDSLRGKIRASEISTRIRNTLTVHSIDRDRSHSTRDRSSERSRRFLDLDRRVRKITQDSRNDEYGSTISVISSFLKTDTLPNYDSTFEVIRQAFVIALCIAYGLSMSKSKKLFTGSVVDRINRFALR